jgi:hypothetical protein
MAWALSQDCLIAFSTVSGEPIHLEPEHAVEPVWVYQLLSRMLVYIMANLKLGANLVKVPTLFFICHDELGINCTLD